MGCRRCKRVTKEAGVAVPIDDKAKGNRLGFRVYTINSESLAYELLHYFKGEQNFSFDIIIFFSSCIYSLRHRKCSVRGYMHEVFVSKTRTSEARASEGF